MARGLMHCAERGGTPRLPSTLVAASVALVLVAASAACVVAFSLEEENDITAILPCLGRVR
ncbi:hypothetical protein ACHAXS_011646 [Conticribra weissflogii]